jgi:hypothetical protein
MAQNPDDRQIQMINSKSQAKRTAKSAAIASPTHGLVNLWRINV